MRLRFIPDEPLAPDAVYEVGVEVCADIYETYYIGTSSYGAPLDCDPVGSTYITNLATGTFVEPAGLGDLLSEFLNIQVALMVAEQTDDGASIRVGGGTTRAQELCFPTSELEGSLSGPFVTVPAGTIDFMVDVENLLEVEGTHIEGVLASNCASLDIPRVSGQLDGRALAPALEEYLGTTDPAEFCALVSAFGVSCTACDSDGDRFCIDYELSGLQGSQAVYELEPRSFEDISVDPTCASVSSCSQAPTGPRAWSVLGLGILGLIGRRRWRDARAT
jgi:hypothetical protein